MKRVLVVIALAACTPRTEPSGARLAARPAPSPARAAPAAAPPVGPTFAAGSGVLGTAHPFVFVRADPRARWVVACQAREDTNHDGRIEVGIGHHGDVFGDEMKPYLFLGGGAGLALDDFVAAEPSGDRLAFVRGGRLLVLDAETRTTLDLSALGADASDDPNPFGGHRALSFDGRGTLLYVRGEGERAVAVVRTAAGAESIVSPGPGLLWRAGITPGGGFVVAHVVGKDANGDGALTIPKTSTSLSKRGCRGPITSYSTGGVAGDQPEVRVAPLHGEVAAAVEGVTGDYGDALVVESARGMELIRGATRTSWTTDACNLQYGDPTRKRAIWRCGQELRLWTPEGVRPLAVREGSVRRQPPSQAASRWVAVAGSPSGMVDVETGTLVALRPDESIAWQSGPHVLVRKANAPLTWLDAEHGTRKSIPGGSDLDWADAGGSTLVAMNGLVIDMAHGVVVRRYRSPPLALSDDARMLVALTSGKAPPGGGVGSQLPSGPLTWEALE